MFIIPMAGRSSRFFSAGYDVPKYQLPLWGQPMFDWVLASFENYFKTDEFVFITLDEYDNVNFISDRCNAAGIERFRIVTLDGPTSGQAATVYQGLEDLEAAEDIFIFNADSFHKRFSKPVFPEETAGGLDVFRGEGTHWSFIEAGPGNTVIRTTEKNRISDYCSDGMYYFESLKDFREAFIGGSDDTVNSTGETYIAPMYNHLIDRGKTIRYRLVNSNDLFFCGTPAEYDSLLKLDNPFAI